MIKYKRSIDPPYYILVEILKKEENINMQITAHCIVKNEDRWIWFAIKSVLPFVKEILVFDTGSSDKTVEVIKSIDSEKIIFEEKGEVLKSGLTKLRQEMVNKTKTEWFLILDGDEIWPERSIRETIQKAKNSKQNIIAVFNPVRNCIGDVFHYLPETEGKYQIKDKVGNFNIRLIKKTPTLQVVGDYPLEVYCDKNGPLQNQRDNLIFADHYFIHTSFLKRSSGDSKKVSGSFGKNKVWQSGIRIGKNELPDVLFEKYPEIVKNPFKKRGFIYEAGSIILKPLISAKRKMA